MILPDLGFTKEDKIFLAIVAFAIFIVSLSLSAYVWLKTKEIGQLSQTTPPPNPFTQLSNSPPPAPTLSPPATASEGLDANGVYYPKKSLANSGRITWKKFHPEGFDLILNIPRRIGTQKIILYPLNQPVIPSQRAWILQNNLGGEITRIYLSSWQHKDAESEFGLIFEQVESSSVIRSWRANNRNRGVLIMAEQEKGPNVWLNVFYDKSPLNRSGTDKILTEIIKSLR